MSIPRIRGAVGQIDGGPDDGKWVYQISIWTLDGETQIGEPFLIGPFATEEIAGAEGKKAIRKVCETAEKHLGDGKLSGKYFDLKNGGVMRPWESHS